MILGVVPGAGGAAAALGEEPAPSDRGEDKLF